MCKEVEHNREVLAQLVYSNESFTEEWLSDEYRNRQGSLFVDGYNGVLGYLRSLCEFGALRYEHGRYIVRSLECSPRSPTAVQGNPHRRCA